MRITEGNFDEAYLADRLRVGQAHERVEKTLDEDRPGKNPDRRSHRKAREAPALDAPVWPGVAGE
jgi:hypothetical protein